MTNKHTPGPWEATVTGNSGGPHWEDVYEVNSDNGMRRVAEYMSEADAKLIAAAPDLLAALRPFALMTDENEDKVHGVYIDARGVVRAKGSLLAALDRARAAIAAAEGRS